MAVCSSTNSRLLQTKSNLACSQAAAKMCPYQMVRLASHGGSRHALQHPQSKKYRQELLKSVRANQKYAAHNQSDSGEGVLMGGEKGCVTNFSAHNSISWEQLEVFSNIY